MLTPVTIVAGSGAISELDHFDFVDCLDLKEMGLDFRSSKDRTAMDGSGGGSSSSGDSSGGGVRGAAEEAVVAGAAAAAAAPPPRPPPRVRWRRLSESERACQP
jgi:hypothetical protein